MIDSFPTTTRKNKSVKLEPIHLLYDERMLLHRPIGWIEPTVFPEDIDECDDDYPMENPERLRVIYDRLCEVEGRLLAQNEDGHTSSSSSIVDGDYYYHTTGEKEQRHLDEQERLFQPLECRFATRKEICRAHSEAQYDRLNELQYLSDEALEAYSAQRRHDIYYCQDTFEAARLAAGGLLACVDATCENKNGTNKAVALVRPPGHHACQSEEMGFCFIDSVVVAAKYAIAEGKAKRVVILDWDIHDGNGTSELTLEDDNIFRIDIHRFNAKEGFYPYTGSPNEIGSGDARGLNLNMAWSHGGMGNAEYGAAFHELILPLVAEYQPDLLLISCGLDAALGDILGGCDLTPDFFHAMTRATLEVVGPNIPVVCALEGGYNMSILPDCMEACTIAMLNCPFRYHTNGSYFGGAALDSPSLALPWTASTSLERSRRILSKYYTSGGRAPLVASAINDINTCIRIFKREPRWKNVTLKKLRAPPKLETQHQQHQRKRKEFGSPASSYALPLDNGIGDRPLQRRRVYMWYGTELHHKAMLQQYELPTYS